jgi:hypothetical protein
MRRALTIIGASLLAAAPVLAGINPASPGLPRADTSRAAGGYTGFTALNNGASSMCVDCHTIQPKAGGSHYVNATTTAGATNSGGSGIGAAGTIVTRDNGAYFKAALWNTGRPSGTTGSAGLSKYGSITSATSAVSVSTDNTVVGVKTTTTVAASALDTYDIICESCHNIVQNEAGGNNLLDTQPNNEWEDTPVAEICVMCHGFMYTTHAANTTAPANAAYSVTGVNANEVAGGHKSNNEYHWIKGVAYPQNHHVMTGDNIDSARAAAGLLWTDNLIVSYTDQPIDNTSVLGTYPQKADWTPLNKPSNIGWLSCTNCHTPAHGFNGSPAASILRNATYTVAGSLPISRISDRNAWKKIDDLGYCGQCHE